MVVQQHVLNWLYSVLTSEYHDVNRTYNDVAQALSQYPSLLPRTDVHTFPNGTSALLLHLSGTIPVSFRGTTYRFPISLWVPHAYPREAPLVYVTPTENMVVRPGQHVDPQGLVYHPYLVGWSTFWDKSTILDFLAILRDIFAKEPPVIARQPGKPPPSQQQPATPPPVPPLPPDLAPRPTSQVQSRVQEDVARPPPPPPKPGARVEVRQQPSPAQSQTGGPPLPPLPPHLVRTTNQYNPDASRSPPQQNQQQPQYQQHPRAGPSRYDSAPPLPQQEQPQTQPQPRFSSPPSTQYSPREAQYQGPPPGSQAQGQGQAQPQFDPRQNYATPPPPPPPWQQQQQQQQPPPPFHAVPHPKPPPPPDLMNEDLNLTIPSPSSTPAAPPIPPNPEKDALQHQLAQTLYSLRQRTHAQNAASLAGLRAQRDAMQRAEHLLQTESAQLSELSDLLSRNTAILQDSLRKADGVIESSARLPAPDIDELLVAPTVVGNQLYELVAEERALADTIFVLGRAVERGRIAPSVFTQMTRILAREWFLKKWRVRKIGVGMGLES
ncbi:ESCRT-I component [Cercophora scortea]|uniref:ESCRT-I component n=1 Tax=Cercophora scortea TaxID=314031 RepID=A0AAE0IWP6_9PEZI|nr:ESCRT-I component [Cercophora scortea]